MTGRRGLEELSRRRQAISEIEARFRERDPDYVPLAPPLAMDELRALAKTAAAVIVEFRVTSEGTYVFLLGPDHDSLPTASSRSRISTMAR